MRSRSGWAARRGWSWERGSSRSGCCSPWRSFGVVDADAYVRFWPALLVALGLAKLSRAAETGGWFGAVFLMGLGAGLLLDRLGYLALHRFWPFLVILARLALIQRALPPRPAGASG